MTTRTVAMLLSSTTFLASACATGQPGVPEMPQVPEASYVFRGTIADAGSSTLDQLPPDADTYSIVVDEIYYQRGTFEDQTGSRITLRARDATLEPGRQYVIYSEPFLFGTSIAVELVEATQDDRPGVRIGEEARFAQEQRELLVRVREAEVIVTGTVVRVGPLDQAARPESEHLPDLRRAFLQVDRVLKGDLTPGEVAFLFAASRDVQWYQAPKFNPEDEGIFLLNLGGEAASLIGVPAREFTLFDPLDFQPPDKLEIIRALL